MTVREFYTRYGKTLRLKLVGTDAGYDRRIMEPALNRCGLALTGFYTYFAEQRIQVIGNAELSYLESLDDRQRASSFAQLCQQAIPCVILARGHHLSDDLMEEAEKAGVSVFQSTMASMKLLNAATIRLQWAFAPTCTEHGCMVDIRGIGVLLRGTSGAGKSETVLGLIDRGASLVADDIVHLRALEGGDLMATAPDLSRYHMEVRGLGIINAAALFGVGVVRIEKALNMVITLKANVELSEMERVGTKKKTFTILGVDVPHVELPVAPGRDLAKLIEVAALDQKLKAFGHDSAVEFNNKLLETMRNHYDDI
ncbi:MAG: HPr(Ser) kinase/phosphatase [Verrucomicrobiota bacterium]